MSVEAGDDGGAVLRFTDTGQGIAAEDIETALTPYGQIGAGSGKAGEHNRQAANGSFGLGLPMAKAIAEAHGGSLSIESKVGIGTTVTLILPG
jgi:signal transduction histidine kinase